MSRFLLPLLLMLALYGTASASPLTLIYSGNLDGELEPCGCSETGNLGGLQRRATLLERLRAEAPQLVAISSGGLLRVEGAGDRLKSEYILAGFKRLGYDAIGLQWRDLALGPELVLEAGLPWVASNWHDDRLPASRLIERKAARIAFFSWLDPQQSPFQQMQGSHSLVNDDVAGLHRALREAKAAGALTVLATELPLKLAISELGLDDVDILIQRSAYEEYGEPVLQGETLVLQPGSRGMRLGRLDLTLAEGRIQSWRHQVLPMPDTIPDAEKMRDWYEDYNAAVKAAYLKRVELRKQREQGQSPYVGEEVCQTCHQAEHKTWAASDHAMAYDDLEAVGKSFDPECIQCHVVGFDQPGGFVDMSLTGHLLGVQCESCHGAGRAHVEALGKAALPNSGWDRKKICAQCHTQPHSPGFDIDAYWQKIRH
ncbi:MAG TPA: hypothetical protein ENK51_06450 [Gammaproteobacteria bacterium]|nr:hypothetical protein [Gammaproteobacteria bacterium]